SGQHSFDRECTTLEIEHRLTPPRHPQTNGMVERFNRRIGEVVAQTRFASAQELKETLLNYLQIYNHHIPQKALNHKTPVQVLEECQENKPELFKKYLHDQARLDTSDMSKTVSLLPVTYRSLNGQQRLLMIRR